MRGTLMLVGVFATGALTVGLTASAVQAGTEGGGKPVDVGRPAPDFKLTDTQGRAHQLADFKGRIVVLEWTNHKCPFIKHHEGKARTMQKTAAALKSKGVVWLAVDSSSFATEQKGEINEWIKQNKIEYPILLDPDGKVGRAFGAKTTPHMFVIDQRGVLAYRGAIDDDPSLKGKEGTRNYVMEAVTALLNGSTVAEASTKSYGCSVKYKK